MTQKRVAGTTAEKFKDLFKRLYTLERSALKGRVVIPTKSSAPADSDYDDTPKDGTIVLRTDTTPKRLYVRSGDWSHYIIFDT